MSNPREEYIDWKYSDEAVACLFARFLSKKPEIDGFTVEVIDASKPPERIAKQINSAVSDAITAQHLHSLTIILPDMGDFGRWMEVSKLLSEYEGWQLDEVTFSETEKDKVPFDANAFVYMQLTKLLARADGAMIPSEALFLGPYDFFPHTRQSPHCALELYVGTPRSTDAISNKPTERANLAHIDARLPTKRTFDRMAEQTKALRLKSLGLTEDQEDLRAKAKVSFVIPSDQSSTGGSI